MFAPRVFHSVSVRTLTERDKKNAGDKGCAEACTERFFLPERPTMTSRVSSLSRGHFRNVFMKVFGNARILIFYLSIKAWEEKSLPKTHISTVISVIISPFYRKKRLKD